MRGHLKPIRSKSKKFSSVSSMNQDYKVKKINSKVMIGLGGRIEVRIEVKAAMTDVWILVSAGLAKQKISIIELKFNNH